MNRLKDLRRELQATQGDIADRVGVSRTTYTKYESGDIQLGEDILCKLADFYGVSVDYLLGRTTVFDSFPDTLSKTERALNGELHELTEAEQQDVLAYIRFRRLQKRKGNLA